MTRWEWRLLRAGSFRLDGGSMFGVVPKALWSRSATPDEANRIPLQTNCLLLTRNGTSVVVETGFGGKWSDKERSFYDLERRTIADALREVGVEPDDIDHVIVTHLHFDHAAGLTRRADGASGGDAVVPQFPRAEVVVQQTEWDDALANKSTMTRTYLRDHLDPVADQVRTVTGEAEVLPGIRVMPVPGHTWGQQAVLFNDGDGPVCFPGDVMPTIAHAGLAYNMAYDMEPYTNMGTKRRLLRRAAAEEWRLVLDHEPERPVVRVAVDAPDEDRWRLEPVADRKEP